MQSPVRPAGDVRQPHDDPVERQTAAARPRRLDVGGRVELGGDVAVADAHADGGRNARADRRGDAADAAGGPLL